jgi:hypothetical protein
MYDEFNSLALGNAEIKIRCFVVYRLFPNHMSVKIKIDLLKTPTTTGGLDNSTYVSPEHNQSTYLLYFIAYSLRVLSV